MSLSAYQDLLARKRVAFEPRGLDAIPALSPALKDHQRATVAFLLRAGCGAAFLDTGLGKTLVALEWGRIVSEHMGGMPVLMLAPLAVGQQHAREAAKFGIPARYVRLPDASEVTGSSGVIITNYERLHLVDPSLFAGVILDESSILKSFTGKTKQALVEAFAATPFRLALTATPAPNDHMELGNHAEFLGVMRSREMLSRWFINDTSEASQKWRLKGHARAAFWDWVASWSRCVAKPSDLGFDDAGYDLPALVEHHHQVAVDRSVDRGEERDGQMRLMRMPEMSATSIHKEKRRTIAERAAALAAAVRAEAGEAWVLWCDTNDEADALKAALPEAIEVRGAMSLDEKETRLSDFSEGRAKWLITKPSIAGFGLNWQHCARVGFVGLSFSYEAYYQAVRRCWRFGQARPVHVHIACAETEKAAFDAVARKQGDHAAMKSEMSAAMARSGRRETVEPYSAGLPMEVPAWLN